MSCAIIIAAPKSGSGKTTLTLGLMRALSRRGQTVQGFKSGPDYIDPAFHAAATGRASLNLDSWCMSEALIGNLVTKGLEGADIALIEASMGLFDGVPAPPGKSGSSADLAALLGLPVLLVVDVSGQAGSVAALVRGFASHEPKVRIAGVVLNKVASARHRLLTESAIAALGIPVLGCLPPNAALVLPERHLGLVQAGETADLAARLDALADFVTAHCDLEAIAALATAPYLPPAGTVGRIRPPGQRIALAQDRAFSFIYPHLIQHWRAVGAEIMPFSPLADEAPSLDADCCWLPGGYPELHAGTLAASSHFLAGLRRFAQSRPVHGECGGYMVLGQTLTDAAGTVHAMAGLLGVETSFAQRKMTLGYRAARLEADGMLGQRGTQLLGHEFHYSTTLGLGDDASFAAISDAYDDTPKPAGSRRGRVTGSFFHVLATG